MLKAMSIEDEKIDQIIEAHTETVDALKEERDNYKAEAEKLPDVQKELNKIKETTAQDDAKNPYKVKYDALKEEFKAYKDEVSAKEVKADKTKAFRDLLKEVGVSEKRLDSVIKVTDIDSIELEDGKIKDVDALKSSVKEEWADFIPTEGTKGANVSNPPANNGGAVKTKEEIKAIKDTSERQQAWKEYLMRKDG